MSARTLFTSGRKRHERYLARTERISIHAVRPCTGISCEQALTLFRGAPGSGNGERYRFAPKAVRADRVNLPSGPISGGSAPARPWERTAQEPLRSISSADMSSTLSFTPGFKCAPSVLRNSRQPAAVRPPLESFNTDFCGAAPVFFAGAAFLMAISFCAVSRWRRACYPRGWGMVSPPSPLFFGG